MIQNWSTIEKIAKMIRTARANKENKTALMWERLLRKFADACDMVEEYTVKVMFYGTTWARSRALVINAISPCVACAIAERMMCVQQYPGVQIKIE